MNIADLKRRSASISKITSEIERIANPTAAFKDDRFWKLDADKAGNATATIRFLPSTYKTVDDVEQVDEYPWVRVYDHGFQGPSKKWYIEQCPTSFGGKCPLCELNSELWSTGIEANQNIVRSRKRRLKYIMNILVVSDPKHPENDGTVRLFKTGKSIFDKIMLAITPKFDADEPINVFDYFEGANFRLRQIEKEGYPNFEQSSFSDPSALPEAMILRAAADQYLLSEFLNPNKFKSYEELHERLMKTMVGVVPSALASSDDSDDEPVNKIVKPSIKPSIIVPKESTDMIDDNDDAALDYFKKLAQED